MATILYIKQGCPWCIAAEEELHRLGVKYEVREVRSNPGYFEEMKKLSGQTKAPVLKMDNRILSDFDSKELEGFCGR